MLWSFHPPPLGILIPDLATVAKERYSTYRRRPMPISDVPSGMVHVKIWGGHGVNIGVPLPSHTWLFLKESLSEGEAFRTIGDPGT